MKMQYLKNVATLKLNSEKCIGSAKCGMCFEVCPHAVFEWNGKKAAVARLDDCIECGACVVNCPVKAIEVRAGVGCAAAVLKGMLTGKEASCGCGDEEASNSCCS